MTLSFSHGLDGVHGRLVSNLLSVAEVLGSNLDPKTDYPDRCFSGLPLSLQANFGTVL
jgi:hypothetical protein